MEHGGSKLLSTDMDDVLVHIATPWVRRALARPKIQAAWPIAAELLNDVDLDERVIARTHPHIQEWLVDEFNFPVTLVDEVNLIYRADPTFYDELPPTTICQSITAALELPGRVSHVHVITHNFANTDPVVVSKDRWLRKHLGPESRVTIHHLEPHEPKSATMKKFCKEPDSYADDALKNVIDILLNDDVRPHEILIPRMGHNAPFDKLITLAAHRRIKLVYYDSIK